MKKLLGFIVFLVFLLVLLAQFVLPGFVSSQLQNSLVNALHPTAYSLKVDSTPGMKMGLGKIDVVRGDLEDVKLGELTFADIHFNLSNVEVDPFQLLAAKHVVISKIESGEIEGTITEEALQSFLEKKVKGLTVSKISVSDRLIDVKGTITVGGFLKSEANLKGLLEIKNNTLVFSPQDVALSGIKLGSLGSSTIGEITIYDFQEFPVRVQLERIITTNGQIHIFIKPQGK